VFQTGSHLIKVPPHKNIAQYTHYIFGILMLHVYAPLLLNQQHLFVGYCLASNLRYADNRKYIRVC
jgi:hypothetical protein